VVFLGLKVFRVLALLSHVRSLLFWAKIHCSQERHYRVLSRSSLTIARRDESALKLPFRNIPGTHPPAPVVLGDNSPNLIFREHRRLSIATDVGQVEMRLSPAELSFLHTSLTSSPPLRPDLRSLTQYRPYSIQTDFLSTANGSARVTWGTGKEGGDVLVVVKAQIDNTIEISKGVFGGQVSVDVYSSSMSRIILRIGMAMRIIRHF